MAIPFTIVSGAIFLADKIGNLVGISGDRLKVENTDAYNSGVDAFGRKRVSTPVVKFTSTHNKTKHDDVWDEEITGNGTVTHLPNEASINMQIGTAIGDKIIRQTFENFQYVPTQSYAVEFTGNINGGQIGTTKRLGYFDERNGLFFSNKDNILEVNIRSYTSGIIIDNTITRASWDDPMDGTGESGINIDDTKQLIFFIDFQWLGSGTVRFGFSINGLVHYCHTEHHSNFLEKPYSSTATLPIRYEIENTATTAATSSMNWTCTGLISEGDAIARNDNRSISNENGTVTIPSNALAPVISLKITDGETYGAALVLSSLDLLVATNDDIYFEVRMDAAITGAAFQPVVDGHISSFDTTATGYTANTGRLLKSGYISKQGGITLKSGDTDINNIRLGQYIDRTPQVVTILAQAFSGSAGVSAVMSFQEII